MCLNAMARLVFLFYLISYVQSYTLTSIMFFLYLTEFTRTKLNFFHPWQCKTIASVLATEDGVWDTVLWIRIRWIRMFFALPDPDPDPSNDKENICFLQCGDFFWPFIFDDWPSKVISKKLWKKNLFLLASCKRPTKKQDLESGSVNQWYWSADPDPDLYQNVTDPQHWWDM